MADEYIHIPVSTAKAFLTTLQQAEEVCRKAAVLNATHGAEKLAGDVYALGCDIGSRIAHAEEATERDRAQRLPRLPTPEQARNLSAREAIELFKAINESE